MEIDKGNVVQIAVIQAHHINQAQHDAESQDQDLNAVVPHQDPVVFLNTPNELEAALSELHELRSMVEF